MKKLEEIQKSKLVSSYGASGSIIMTKNNGSIIIEEYDQWPFYDSQNNIPKTPIKDVRLLDYIKRQYKSYAGVSDLVTMPNHILDGTVYAPHNDDVRFTISSNYFPTWFYCPYCRRLHKLNDWEKIWNDKFNNDQSFRKNPPACAFCSKLIDNKSSNSSATSSKQKKSRIHRTFLEQVRFVLASLDGGDLKDVPFDRLVVSQPDENVWNINNVKATTDDLYYRTTSGGDGLQSIYIQTRDNGRRLHMSQLLRKYIVIKKHAYKLLLRNNNNLYYPNILRSLYIPQVENELSHRISSYKSDGLSVDETYSILLRKNPSLTIDEVQRLYDNPDAVLPGRDFEFEEFLYITDTSLYNDCNTNRQEDFWSVQYPNLHANFIHRIYGLKQLKETSVLLSYSRVSPEAQDWYNTQSCHTEPMEPEKKLPFKVDNNIDYLPAVESYGEGILFELDLSNIEQRHRYVFAHTYCHMIMKEMEFKCGYPVSSLKEKIYYSEEHLDKIGFLIYTIAGSEGSFGGLLALLPWDYNADSAPIQNLIQTASQRVLHCNNDPICIEEKGHCFACLDLPETSCAKWNKDLDRRVVIDALEKIDNDSNNLEITEDCVLDS